MKLKTMSKLVRTDLVDHLSPRELQVFRRLADGMTCPQIGRELGISAKTAEGHFRNLKLKLRVTGRDLLRLAVLWVFVYGDRVPENMGGKL